MNYTREDVLGYSEGDIVRVGGKRYRLEKKTTTACAFTRYYWFDAVIDWFGKLIDTGTRS